MSRNNSLQLRAALTLGAAALALCVATGPSLAAAANEGHAAGMAAARGGAREAGGMNGGMNERMNSLRVETLSPAGFVSHGPFVSSHVFPPNPPRPVSAGHGVVQDPLQRAQPEAAGNPSQRAQPEAMSRPSLQPVSAGHGVIQDPIQRAQPVASGNPSQRAQPGARRSPEPPVPSPEAS